MLITPKAKSIKGNRSAYLSKSLCPSKPFRCNIYYEYSTWIILCTLSMVKNYYISKVNSQSIPKILNFVLLKNKELTAYPATFYLCSFLINKYEWLNSLLGESPPHQQVAHPLHQILFLFPPTTPTTPKVNATIIKYPCLSYDPIKMSFLAVVIVVIGKGIYPKHP